MKKIIFGMMLVIGSLSFSSEEGSTVKLSNIFDNYKSEQSQENSQEKLNPENSTKISGIFDNYKLLDKNS